MTIELTSGGPSTRLLLFFNILPIQEIRQTLCGLQHSVLDVGYAVESVFDIRFAVRAYALVQLQYNYPKLSRLFTVQRILGKLILLAYFWNEDHFFLAMPSVYTSRLYCCSLPPLEGA